MPTRTDADSPVSPGLPQLVVPILCYLLLFLGADAVTRRIFLATHTPTWFTLIPPARRQMLLEQAYAQDLLIRVAMLCLPFLLLVFLLRWALQRDPLKGLGLETSPGRAWASLAALGLGILAHLTLTFDLALLLRGLDGADHAMLGILALVFGQLQFWAQNGVVALLSLPAAVFCYATTRVLLPHGHLLPLLRQRLHPALAALIVSLLFALPYLLTPAITLLSLFNIVLLGLVLERLRVRTHSVLPPLAFFAGWVLFAELSGLPHQGMPTPVPEFLRDIPAILSGGIAGPIGSLPATVLLSLALLLLLTRSRVCVCSGGRAEAGVGTSPPDPVPASGEGESGIGQPASSLTPPLR